MYVATGSRMSSIMGLIELVYLELSAIELEIEAQ